jgi:hypothetical protein
MADMEEIGAGIGFIGFTVTIRITKKKKAQNEPFICVLYAPLSAV